MPINSLLKPSLKAISAGGEVTTIQRGQSFLLPVYALARSQCSFSRVKLAANNKNGLQAARLQISRSQRYPSPRIRIETDQNGGNHAGTWSWDNDKTLHENTALNTLKVIPETLAREPLQGDGIRLVNCLEGVEGEVWQEGNLMASRWWPATPSTQDWLLFLRASKYKSKTEDAVIAVPEPVTIPWREDFPLIDRDPENLALMFSPTKVAMVAVGLLAFFAALQTSQYYNHKSRIAFIEEKLKTVTRDNQAGYRARAQALSELSKINTKSIIEDPTKTINIVSVIADKIKRSDGQLSSISISEDSLEARLTINGTPDIPEIVNQLESNGLLEDIFIEKPNERFLFIKGKTLSAGPLTIPSKEQNTDQQTDADAPNDSAENPASKTE